VSKLQDGLIPAHTECPFASQCGFKQDDTCNHRGKEHTVNYSCASARLFDICRRYDAKDKESPKS
jgi:hypothetical protein